MSNQVVTKEKNERIQYTHDNEPSSLTIKRGLFDLLSKKLGSPSDAKKFCRKAAVDAKNGGVGKGGVSDAVFNAAMQEVIDPSLAED